LDVTTFGYIFGFNSYSYDARLLPTVFSTFSDIGLFSPPYWA